MSKMQRQMNNACTASAQFAEAASCCENSIIAIVLGAILMASILVVLVNVSVLVSVLVVVLMYALFAEQRTFCDR